MENKRSHRDQACTLKGKIHAELLDVF